MECYLTVLRKTRGEDKKTGVFSRLIYVLEALPNRRRYLKISLTIFNKF